MDYRFTDIHDRLDTLESSPGGTNGYSNTYTDSTAWVVVHNLNSYEIVVNCFEGTGVGAKKVSPNDVNVDSLNQVTIDWGGELVGGRATIVAL